MKYELDPATGDVTPEVDIWTSPNKRSVPFDVPFLLKIKGSSDVQKLVVTIMELKNNNHKLWLDSANVVANAYKPYISQWTRSKTIFQKSGIKDSDAVIVVPPLKALRVYNFKFGVESKISIDKTKEVTSKIIADINKKIENNLLTKISNAPGIFRATPVSLNLQSDILNPEKIKDKLSQLGAGDERDVNYKSDSAIVTAKIKSNDIPDSLQIFSDAFMSFGISIARAQVKTTKNLAFFDNQQIDNLDVFDFVVTKGKHIIPSNSITKVSDTSFVKKFIENFDSSESQFTSKMQRQLARYKSVSDSAQLMFNIKKSADSAAIERFTATLSQANLDSTIKIDNRKKIDSLKTRLTIDSIGLAKVKEDTFKLVSLKEIRKSTRDTLSLALQKSRDYYAYLGRIKVILDTIISEEYTVALNTLANFRARTEWYISPRVGVMVAFGSLAGLPKAVAVPYYGVTFNFLPINREAHYSIFKVRSFIDFIKLLSLDLGVSMLPINKSFGEKWTGVLSKYGFIAGGGLTIFDFVKINSGVLLLQNKKYYPVNPDSKTVALPYLSLGVDLDIQDYIQKIVYRVKVNKSLIPLK